MNTIEKLGKWACGLQRIQLPVTSASRDKSNPVEKPKTESSLETDFLLSLKTVVKQFLLLFFNFEICLDESYFYQTIKPKLVLRHEC